MDLKVPSPLVEAGVEQQACLGLYRFHEAVINIKLVKQSKRLIIHQLIT
ncbi:MAG: hypothetical protein O4965_16355 [Trichodesmium sp. St19_bin1]|nr:hypothetical protein [Trichodesmium sp. St19_bin1]